MQYIPDFRFLRDLYGNHRHAAGWRDEQRVSRVGEHSGRQERREHWQKGQCLGSDTMQCICINDKRIESKDVLVAFCSFLKLRGVSSVAGHIVTFEKSWVPWQTRVTQITLNYSTRQNSNLCPCKLRKLLLITGNLLHVWVHVSLIGCSCTDNPLNLYIKKGNLS